MEDLRDYWAEYNQAPRLPDNGHEPVSLHDTSSIAWEEGEQEAAWLLAAGLPHLAGPWRAGRELWGPELAQALRRLPPHQADAVRRRVASLNHTIARRRAPRRNTPHIRDVFSPSGGMPVSLPPTPAPTTPVIENQSLAQLMSLPAPGTRPAARRVASVSSPTADNTDAAARFELFRGTGHQAREVAGDSDGVLMVGYQRLGTLTPRSRERRSGSDPTSECGSLRIKSSDVNERPVSSSGPNFLMVNTSPVRRASSQGHLASEEAKLAVAAEWHRWASSGPPNEDEASAEARLGRTSFEGLAEEDRSRLRPLLLLEASALLDRCGAPGPKLKPAKKKRRDEPSSTAVFGVPLATLLERDRQIPGCGDLNIPLIFHKLVQLLEREHCLREEGLLRVPGSRARAEMGATAVQSEFYGPHREERAMRALEGLGAHELGALLKRLLRELPQPLLTPQLLDSFYHCHALSEETGERERALRLLSLLLPAPERHVLQVLLEFLAHVAEREEYNKMSLHNVAMIFAPNLFPPAWLHKGTTVADSEENLTQQVKVAAESCRLVEQMVLAGPQLWSVPPPLVRQLRQQYESERFQGVPHSFKENSKPMRIKLLGRRPTPREAIVRVVENEVDFQEGVVRVSAPQFHLTDLPVQLSDDTTASDVLLRVVEEANSRPEAPGANASQHLKLRRQDARARALCELAPNGNLSCFLASAEPATALQTHSLYERGGNIGQRQIDHRAQLLSVYRENPNAQWVIMCHHRNGLPVS